MWMIVIVLAFVSLCVWVYEEEYLIVIQSACEWLSKSVWMCECVLLCMWVWVSASECVWLCECVRVSMIVCGHPLV